MVPSIGRPAHFAVNHRIDTVERHLWQRLQHVARVLDRTQMQDLVVGILQQTRFALQARLQQVDAALNGDERQVVKLTGVGVGGELLQVHGRVLIEIVDEKDTFRSD